MTSQTIHRFSFTALSLGVALFMLAATAAAQAPATSSTSPTATTTATAPPATPTAATTTEAIAVSDTTTTDTTAAAAASSQQMPTGEPQGQVGPAYWSSIAGFEGDSHKTGYGFFGPQYVHPFKPNMAWVGGFNGNYLFYQFANGSGTTHVSEPGLSTAMGLRFGGHNWVQVQAGPSFKRKNTEFRDASDVKIGSDNRTQVGLSMGASVYADPTRHNNIHGMVDYSTTDHYVWSRLGYKEQISNRNWSGKFTHYLGVEYIDQGNKDIHSQQVGGFIEFLHVPSSISVMLRTGYKRSTFQLGPNKTGPWFAVSFYERLK